MRVKLAAILCMIVVLSGCKSTGTSLNSALTLRNKIAESSGCSFHTTVTADYGEKIYTFSMDCQADNAGNLTFSVTEPDTIAGITGKISAAGGAITFDDKVLAFETIADGQVTPVTAPWLFLNTLRGGYIRDSAAVDQGVEVSIDDSYADEALHLKIIIKDDSPVSAEIFCQGRRVLTLSVENLICL